MLNKEMMKILKKIDGDTDYKTESVTNLKHFAKLLKIKGWWNLKKAEIIEEIDKLMVQYNNEKDVVEEEPTEEPEIEEKEVVELPHLTNNEKLVLNALRTNEYGDSIEAGHIWSFSVIDNSWLDGKVARGVISSLVKKDLVEVVEAEGKDCPEAIALTDLGIKIFDLADGDENKEWGGPNLFKVEIPKKVEKEEVKKEVVKSDDDLKTVKDLAEMFDMTPKKVRSIIRKKANVTRTDSRWEWSLSDKEQIEIYNKVVEVLTKYIAKNGGKGEK